eukprot:331392-Chlamydomonas_euryale.AAC.14
MKDMGTVVCSPMILRHGVRFTFENALSLSVHISAEHAFIHIRHFGALTHAISQSAQASTACLTGSMKDQCKRAPTTAGHDWLHPRGFCRSAV